MVAKLKDPTAAKGILAAMDGGLASAGEKHLPSTHSTSLQGGHMDDYHLRSGVPLLSFGPRLPGYICSAGPPL